MDTLQFCALLRKTAYYGCYIRAMGTRYKVLLNDNNSIILCYLRNRFVMYEYERELRNLLN